MSTTVLTTKPTGRRLVMLSIPLQGHINPMLQHANMLHSKGFSITILHTHFNAPNPFNYPLFSFVPIPGVAKDNLSMSNLGNVMQLIYYLNDKCLEPIGDCLSRLMREDEGVASLITDTQWFATQSVADKLKLPWIVHRTNSVSSFILFSSLPLLRDMGYFRGFSEEDFQMLENVMNVAGSSKLYDCMRLWFVQQAGEDYAFSKLLFACCQHLRRVMAKNHTMMANMEALGPRGVDLELLDVLRKTQERHRLLLEKLNSLFNQEKVGVCAEEANAIKMN